MSETNSVRRLAWRITSLFGAFIPRRGYEPYAKKIESLLREAMKDRVDREDAKEEMDMRIIEAYKRSAEVARNMRMTKGTSTTLSEQERYQFASDIAAAIEALGRYK